MNLKKKKSEQWNNWTELNSVEQLNVYAMVLQ